MNEAHKPSPKEVLRILFSGRMLVTLIMGFAAGMPLLLTADVLKFWLRGEGLDLTTIGLLSLIGLPYSLKFLWAPLLDRYSIFSFGRRRGWLLTSQLLLTLCLLLIASLNPGEHLSLILAAAFGISCASATQDMVIDAYRREHLAESELGFGASLYVFGYRVALLLAGGVGLILADHVGFANLYLAAAGVMVVLMLVTLLSPEPETGAGQPTSLRESIIQPLLDLLRRPGILWILGFALFYKLGDSMAAAIAYPFYRDLGFTGTEVGSIAKGFGFVAAVVGGFVGGILLLRMRMANALFSFGVLQMLSTACFALLALDLWRTELAIWLTTLSGSQFDPISLRATLAFVIGVENFTSGMGTAAFVAFLGQLTHIRFTATQFALLTALTSVPRVFFGATTGVLVEQIGWVWFFLGCALVAIPGLLLIFMIDQQKFSLTGGKPG